MDVVPVEVQTTVEQCPLAIEGYVGPLGDLEEEMPEDYEWGNEAVLEPSDLPNLALVTWNEVVALDSRRCSMCPALIKASCLLFQTAKKLRSSGVQ